MDPQLVDLVRALNLSYFELRDKSKCDEVIKLFAHQRRAGFPQPEEIESVLEHLLDSMTP